MFVDFPEKLFARCLCASDLHMCSLLLLCIKAAPIQIFTFTKVRWFFCDVKGVARSVTRPQLCAASQRRSSDWFGFSGPQLNCFGSDFLILSVLFTHEQNCRQLFPVIESSLTNPLYPAEDKVCNLPVDIVVHLTAGATYFPQVSSGGERQTVVKKRVSGGFAVP